MLKQGGEDSYALLQERGEERRSFLGRAARSLSQLFYDVPEATSKRADATFGGYENQTKPVRGGGGGASGNLPEPGTRSPAGPPAHASLRQQLVGVRKMGAGREEHCSALYPRGATREEAQGAERGVSGPQERPVHATRTWMARGVRDNHV